MTGESLDTSGPSESTVGIKTRLGNMLVLQREDGNLDWVHRTPKNELLYDPDRYGVDVLLVDSEFRDRPKIVRDTPENRAQLEEGSFEQQRKSLYEFLQGAPRDDLLSLTETDPMVSIAPTSDTNVYRLRVGGPENHVVYTPTTHANDVLKGVIQMFDSGHAERLTDIYHDVLAKQVRRDMVRKFVEWGIIPEQCITETPDGWVLQPIDQFGEPDVVKFIVTYEAENYLYTHNWDAVSHTPRGRENDTAGQFRALEFGDIDPICETVFEPVRKDGRVEMEEKEYQFTERETKFFFTVQWMLDWVENFDDPASVHVIRRTFTDHGGTLR